MATVFADWWGTVRETFEQHALAIAGFMRNADACGSVFVAPGSFGSRIFGFRVFS